MYDLCGQKANGVPEPAPGTNELLPGTNELLNVLEAMMALYPPPGESNSIHGTVYRDLVQKHHSRTRDELIKMLASSARKAIGPDGNDDQLPEAHGEFRLRCRTKSRDELMDMLACLSLKASRLDKRNRQLSLYGR